MINKFSIFDFLFSCEYKQEGLKCIAEVNSDELIRKCYDGIDGYPIQIELERKDIGYFVFYVFQFDILIGKFIFTEQEENKVPKLKVDF